MTTSEGRVFDRPRTSSASVNSNFRFRPCDRLHADISRGRGISSLDLITCMLRISTSTFRSGLSLALACTVKRSCMNHCAWTPGRFLDHRRENLSYVNGDGTPITARRLPCREWVLPVLNQVPQECRRLYLCQLCAIQCIIKKSAPKANANIKRGLKGD